MTRPTTGSRGFGVWLAAASVSTLGDSVTAFALAWSAAAHGAGATGVVLVAEGVPLCALILVGGVAADRWGVRRLMIVCDLAMAAVLVAFVTALRWGQPVWLLALAAVLSGTAAALRRPAAGVFPRLFTRDLDRELVRLTATVSMSAQLARIAGPAVAGVLLGSGGLTLTSAGDALTFLLVAGVLLRVRPPYEATAPADRTTGGGALVALRLARRAPGVPATLLAVTLLAAAVLPLMELCVPVAGRERHWSAHATGLVAGAWVAGGLVMTAGVTRRVTIGARLAVAGPLVAAGGVVLFAATRTALWGGVGIAAVGVGTVLLTARLFPRFVAATPPAMLARYQSLLGLAQTGPVLLVLPLLATVADRAGPDAALGAVAAMLVLAALAAARAGRLTARPEPAPEPRTAPIPDDAPVPAPVQIPSRMPPPRPRVR